MMDHSMIFSSLAYGAGLLGGLQMPELIVILILVLIIFGPKNLPKIGQALGASLREFREASKKITDEVQNESAAPPRTLDPSGRPAAAGSPAAAAPIPNSAPAPAQPPAASPGGPSSPGGGNPLTG